MINSDHREGDDTPHSDSDIESAAQRGHGAFFGRRKGHKLRNHQAELIAQLLPHLSVDILQPAPVPLTELFGQPMEAVRLEIGFGGGLLVISGFAMLFWRVVRTAARAAQTTPSLREKRVSPHTLRHHVML